MSQAEPHRAHSMTSGKAGELHALVAGFDLSGLLVELEAADLDVIRDSLAEAEQVYAGLVAAGRTVNDLVEAAAELQAQRKAVFDVALQCTAAATGIASRAVSLASAIAGIIDAPAHGQSTRPTLIPAIAAAARQILDGAVDLLAADTVAVTISADATRLWCEINGRLALRCYGIRTLSVRDDRLAPSAR